MRAGDTEPDYKKCLGYAGLEIDVTTEKHFGTFEITKMASPSDLQQDIQELESGGAIALNQFQ